MTLDNSFNLCELVSYSESGSSAALRYWTLGGTAHIVFYMNGTPWSATLWNGATQWPERWDGNKPCVTCLTA